MGWLCDRVVEAGGIAIADFVCPTDETRKAFGKAFTIWVNRISSSHFEDTNRIFTPPERFDIEVLTAGSSEFWAEKIARMVCPDFDWTKNTALFVGRYQPFHEGHRKLITKGIETVGQACIAVREMPKDDNNPFSFGYVKARIESSLSAYRGHFIVVQLPNISHILYGRDVGYTIERVQLDSETEAISATRLRALINTAHPSSLT